MRDLVKNLAALLIGLAAAFILAEIALSWLIPPPLHYIYPQPTHQRDRELGWIMRPGQGTYTIDKPVRTNSFGFRSPEFDPHRSGKGLRVLCLGDSNTFGNGVSQDETYPAQLQMLLASRISGAAAEAINAGIGGYGTTQEVDLLTRMAPLLSPDVVTIGFYLNDLGDAVRDNLEILDETGEEKRLGFKRFTPYRLIYLLKRSRLVTLVYWRFRLLRSGSERDPLHQVLLGRTPPAYEESWRRIEDALSRARDLARARGFRLIVFPVPTGQEFLEDRLEEQYRSRFITLAERLGIEHFDPTPRMKALGGSFERYFITWDGHINARTHRLIAASLYEMLAPAIPEARAAGPEPPR
jgi:lysophospholipase L1-like esterase